MLSAARPLLVLDRSRLDCLTDAQMSALHGRLATVTLAGGEVEHTEAGILEHVAADAPGGLGFLVLTQRSHGRFRLSGGKLDSGGREQVVTSVTVT